MKLKLARHMSFHHDLHLLIFRPRGILTKARIEKDIAILEAMEDRADQPFNRFSDLSNVDVSRLDFEFIFRIALHRRLKYANRPPIRSAFYVTNEETARIVKVHALLTDYSPISAKMFEELPAAAKWLEVSEDDLLLGK